MNKRARRLGEVFRIFIEITDKTADPPVEVFLHMAYLYFFPLGLHEQAHAALLVAIEREPGYQEAHSLLGQILTNYRIWDAAGHHLRLAIALSPRDPISWGRLSNLYAAMKHLEAAVMAQQELVQLMPENREHQSRLNMMLTQGLTEDLPEYLP